MKNIQTLLNWFTRNWNDIKDNHCWYNTRRVLTNEEITKIKNYLFKKEETNFVIIINGTKWLRPQRTFGCMPEWFRSADADHTLYHDDNAFVFVDFYKPKCPRAEEHQYKKIENLEERKRLQEEAMRILTEMYEKDVKAIENLLNSAKEIANETQSKLYIYESEE